MELKKYWTYSEEDLDSPCYPVWWCDLFPLGLYLCESKCIGGMGIRPIYHPFSTREEAEDARKTHIANVELVNSALHRASEQTVSEMEKAFPQYKDKIVCVHRGDSIVININLKENLG